MRGRTSNVTEAAASEIATMKSQPAGQARVPAGTKTIADVLIKNRAKRSTRRANIAHRIARTEQFHVVVPWQWAALVMASLPEPPAELGDTVGCFVG